MSYITKGIGGFYYVQTGTEIVECKAKGIFRKRHITPVAGDEVQLEQEAGQWVIAEILPRKNVFIRPPVANLDVLFIVASTVQPVPSTLVLDKLTAIAVDKGVQPVIVCTKGDLASTDSLAEIYEKTPIPFIKVDYKTGAGLDELRGWIAGRLCAFCGNSGVGKSTLMSALAPELAQQTGSISQKLGTLRACYIPKENLQHAFPEFEPYFGQCQFTGCAHRGEKGCAVKQALEAGEIVPTRYDSYAAMYDEAKQVKEWELR